MRGRGCGFGVMVSLALGSVSAGPESGPPVRLVERAADPHGSPRPARDERDVPLRTSLYLELKTPPGAGEVSADSVTVVLGPEGGEAVTLLRPGRRFGEGASGWLKPKQDLAGARSLAVYIEPGGALKPETRYAVRVSAARAGAAGRSGDAGSWVFTTEAAPVVRALEFPLDLRAEPVRWHGRFFSGLCNVIFCSQAANYGPTYALMAEARTRHPRAWDYQRDFWPTGTEFRPAGFLPQRLPNLVRERETRRVAAIETRPGRGGLVLRVEDVFGHAQYGIPAGRPVSADYHPGDEVLIADGVNDARTRVVAADDAAGTVTVAAVPTPPGGWKIAYEGPLPDREDPDAPGLFAPGGCYLRKFAPHGTACYYWGRLDKEWDLAHKRYGRRLMVNFADAPGDLARDGRSWTTVKDYAQWHDVARTIAGHLIDRYGAAALGFTWSVFNEPDLGPLFWRADWDELQTFYDDTTDAILRAFEDRGYDSQKVFIGGLELGGIFGTNLRLREFLVHCSPRAEAKGATPKNAAVADRRLDGKRSRRVEALCRDHAGKGTPCDFVSVHSYNGSALMAAKLAKAKETALEIDPDYYKALWVNCHEACPDWMPPPDEAAADSYLGDGYFPTWCADVVRRQLGRAAADPRYAYGETILTVWPPPANFAGLNAVTRVLHRDDDGDGRADATVTVPMPIFHALGLLSDMGDRYWALPERAVGGGVVSGFASRDDRGVVRVLLYDHHPRDTQSRSGAASDVTLDLSGLGWSGPARVREYRFDRDHNTPFRAARALRDRPEAGGPVAADRLREVTRGLDGPDPEAQRAALRALHDLGPATRQAALAAVVALAGRTKDPGVRAAADGVIRGALGPPAYPRAAVEEIEALTRLQPGPTLKPPRGPDGRLRVNVRLAANGCDFLIVEPDVPAVAPAARRDLRLGKLRVGKVLFLGNSVTRHPPAPGIGWAGDWGMAASAPEKDYVHLLLDRIAEVAGGRPEVMVKNLADFERHPTDYDLDAGLKDALAFGADVVVVAIGANVPAPTTDEARAGYRAACTALLCRLKRRGDPAVFVRSEFWSEPVKDGLMKQACHAAGGLFVDLGGPAGDEANLARSERKFDHAGVGGHPGDRGMRVIADALWKAFRERADPDGPR